MVCVNGKQHIPNELAFMCIINRAKQLPTKSQIVYFMHCYLMKTGKTLLTKENYQYPKYYRYEISNYQWTMRLKTISLFYSNANILCSLHPQISFM